MLFVMNKNDIVDNQTSVNLQYITLNCLDNGTNKSLAKSLMFQNIILLYFFRLMPYPCSHFYFDIKFGDRLYSKENR